MPSVRARRAVADSDAVGDLKRGVTKTGNSNEFTYEEVHKHNKRDDCWLIIRGKVYDVTSWVEKHPGGVSFITLRAGQDCTAMFESYHPLAVRKLLPKYEIGTAVGYDGPLVEFQPESKFYVTLKQRVEAYFRDNNINPRDTPAMYLKSIFILTMLALSHYGTYYAFESFWPSLVSALIHGFFVAQIGVSVMHDANHGGYSNSPLTNAVMGATLDLIGSSSFIWRQQHCVGHHQYTNIDGSDPDIRVAERDPRRITGEQPWYSWHRYQHIYSMFMYGLLGPKSVFVDDFKMFITREIGNIHFDPASLGETLLFWGGKSFYFFYIAAVPMYFGVDPLRVLLLWNIHLLHTGYWLAFMFQVAHVVDHVDFPPAKDVRVVPGDWAEMQIRTTANFATDSAVWHFISGGLSFQVEHHLFPTVCHIHYPAMKPIVKATCQEFGLPYHDNPTFMKALAAHIRQLKKAGSGFTIPHMG